MSALRVCWFGIYDPSYPRNDILLRGLRTNGAEIIECHADWRDKNRYKILREKLRALDGAYDIVYAAHPSPGPVLVAKLVSRKPVVMDALYSMFDAAVNDRQEMPWYHPRAMKLWILDWLSALACDAMVVDTIEDQKYWSRFPFVRASKMLVLYTGIQEQIFYPAEHEPAGREFLVSFHGFYIPLQGVDRIVEAARLLRDEPDIRFRFIGSGQLSKKVDGLIEKYGLTTIEQVGRKTSEEVAALSREAHVVLGIFGATNKAQRVVPNKVYEGLGLRKPVITMDTPAVREIFDDADLLLIDNAPESIAQAIRSLKADPAHAREIAERGHAKVTTRYSPTPLGGQLLDFLVQLSSR
ncbi:MAG TPA: glycosyltransferase [Candidatus Paceibacterota bacterium]|nr:glycosyltransferase [Candidatus Paceibacterota bacterium]